MNHTFSLTEFQKHLRVAEPKRGEIIAELKTHINETDDTSTLGNPKQLAQQENLVHLGIFASDVFLFALPLITLALTTILQMVNRQILLSGVELDVNTESIFYWGIIGLQTGAAVLASRIMIRMHRPVIRLILLIGMTWFVSALLGFFYNAWHGPSLDVPSEFNLMFLQSLALNLFMLLRALVVFSLGLILFADIKHSADRAEAKSLKLQLLTAGLVGNAMVFALGSLISFSPSIGGIQIFSIASLGLGLVWISRFFVFRWQRVKKIELTLK